MFNFFISYCFKLFLTLFTVGLNESYENENKKSPVKTSPSKCVWNENSVKLLLSFLINHKEEVNKRQGGSMIKTKLWDDAAIMLSKSGHNYTAKQCSIKWKNIKKDYNDSNNRTSNNSNEVRYKSEVEKILGGNRSNLIRLNLNEKSNEEILPIGKRKMLDEDKLSNKTVKLINYENEPST